MSAREIYVAGVVEGRRQIREPVMSLIEHMIKVSKTTMPVEAHTKVCWQRHPMCALRAVVNRMEKAGGVG